MSELILKLAIGLMLAGFLSVIWYAYFGRVPDSLELIAALWIFIGSNAIWIAFIESDKYYLGHETDGDEFGKLAVLDYSEVGRLLDERMKKKLDKSRKRNKSDTAHQQLDTQLSSA